MSSEEKLKFYEVDKGYIEYLKKIDPKIPNISYENNDKFVCGVVLNINDLDYFVPVSSFKKQQRSNLLILDKDKTVLGSLRFSFMFPIPKDRLSYKDFSLENYQYKRLLNKEMLFCNKNIDKIRNKASQIYKDVVIRKIPDMIKNCCDFELIEKNLKKDFLIKVDEKVEMTKNTKGIKYNKALTKEPFNGIEF